MGGLLDWQCRLYLRCFVPHVGGVLVLAVVLRPGGTRQVSASSGALRWPQLDATAGVLPENGGAGGGGGGGDG